MKKWKSIQEKVPKKRERDLGLKEVTAKRDLERDTVDGPGE